MCTVQLRRSQNRLNIARIIVWASKHPQKNRVNLKIFLMLCEPINSVCVQFIPQSTQLNLYCRTNITVCIFRRGVVVPPTEKGRMAASKGLARARFFGSGGIRKEGRGGSVSGNLSNEEQNYIFMFPSY